MDLYLGMLTCNCLKYTRQALESFRSRYGHRWILIDNGSSDGTREYLTGLGSDPRFIVVLNPQNVGVATGWNQILRKALEDPEFKYCLMASNDIVFEPDTVDLLLEFLRSNPEYLIVSGIDTCRHKKQEAGILDGLVDFACFLISKSCIEKVGLFDEGFTLAYFEDNDYHERVKRAGVRSCIVASSGFYHHGSRAIHEGGIKHEPYFSQNREYFRRKWGFIP